MALWDSEGRVEVFTLHNNYGDSTSTGYNLFKTNTTYNINNIMHYGLSRKPLSEVNSWGDHGWSPLRRGCGRIDQQIRPSRHAQRRAPPRLCGQGYRSRPWPCPPPELPRARVRRGRGLPDPHVCPSRVRWGFDGDHDGGESTGQGHEALEELLVMAVRSW